MESKECLSRTPSYLRRAIGLARTARPIPVAIASLLAAATMAGDHRLPLAWSLAYALPVAGLTAAAFLLNDAFDVRKDKRSGKRRPVAVGEITPLAANRTALCLIVISVLLPIIRFQWHTVCVVLAAAVGIVFYSPMAARHPLWKNAYTAVLCLLPFAIGYSELRSIPIAAPLGMLLLFIWGRELLLDVQDSKGDIAAGVRTLGGRLPQSLGVILSWAAMLIAACGLMAVASGNLQISLASSAAALTLLCATMYPVSASSSTLTTRLVMLLGGLSIAFSGR